MVKNNNPGNIRLSNDVWKGQVIPGTSSDFVTFKDLPYGYRALFILLQNYIRSGYDTIQAIISKYAPESENPTGNYINFVGNYTGIPIYQRINSTDIPKIYSIGVAISRFETGVLPDISAARDGLNMAFTPGTTPDEKETGGLYLIMAGILTAILFSKGS